MSCTCSYCKGTSDGTLKHDDLTSHKVKGSVKVKL